MNDPVAILAQARARQRAGVARNRALLARLGSGETAQARPRSTRLVNSSEATRSDVHKILSLAQRRRGVRNGSETTVTVGGSKFSFRWDGLKRRWQEVAS